jgi:hypothetical protein
MTLATPWVKTNMPAMTYWVQVRGYSLPYDDFTDFVNALAKAGEQATYHITYYTKVTRP